MNLFGIGTPEFIIIFILALIFLGPQRLPEYANKLGQKIREWRMMSQVFMVEWKEELAALEEARQSLAEARSALLEAQQTVTSEVNEVSKTVSTEMESVQRDVSVQLSEAEKAVSDETAQVRKTIAKAKQGKLNVDTVDKAVGTAAAESPDIGSSEPTGDVAGEDTTTVIDSGLADVSDVSDVDISNIEELDEGDVSAMVENTIAPPALAQPTQTSQATELAEIDVAEVRTVSDVASAVAEKIATEVATQVTRKIVKNMTSDMAEEVVALVMAKLAEAGNNGNAIADDGEPSEDVADTEETLESIQ